MRSVVTSRMRGLPKGVPTQLRYGQERCVQAFKAVSAGFDSGPASTGALGADSTVTAAAMVAATMTAVVVFSMTAPCFGVLPVGRGGRATGSREAALRGAKTRVRPPLMPRTALYAGSFDPVTNGHLDVVRHAVRLAEKLVLAVGVNPGKAPLFSADERLGMLKEICAPLARAAKCELDYVTFSGLVVEAARKAGATILIRGLRDSTDFNYEMQMAGMNEAMAPEMQSVFLPASPLARPITATLVRQIAGMGGDVTAFVPAAVAARLKQKFSR